jgi:hypothetical protein
VKKAPKREGAGTKRRKERNLKQRLKLGKIWKKTKKKNVRVLRIAVGDLRRDVPRGWSTASCTAG